MRFNTHSADQKGDALEDTHQISINTVPWHMHRFHPLAHLTALLLFQAPSKPLWGGEKETTPFSMCGLKEGHKRQSEVENTSPPPAEHAKTNYNLKSTAKHQAGTYTNGGNLTAVASVNLLTATHHQQIKPTNSGTNRPVKHTHNRNLTFDH